MKIIENRCKTKKIKEENIPGVFKVNCDYCGSELEITKEDTHIGWLGERFITCPCCGEESMVYKLDGITLTKDNLEFPVHFSRTKAGLRHTVEVKSDEIIKEIKRAITYFRENKNEWSWYTSYGDLFINVYRYSGDEEYFVLVTKDFYETCIPFEEEDYE
jgi:hypothetical protein